MLGCAWQQMQKYAHTGGLRSIIFNTNNHSSKNLNQPHSKRGVLCSRSNVTLDVFIFLPLHHLLSVFQPRGSSRPSPKASWLNTYLPGELRLVCARVCVSVSECVLRLMSVLAVVDLYTTGRALTGCEERMSKEGSGSACRRAKTKNKTQKHVENSCISFHP